MRDLQSFPLQRMPSQRRPTTGALSLATEEVEQEPLSGVLHQDRSRSRGAGSLGRSAGSGHARRGASRGHEISRGAAPLALISPAPQVLARQPFGRKPRPFGRKPRPQPRMAFTPADASSFDYNFWVRHFRSGRTGRVCEFRNRRYLIYFPDTGAYDWRWADAFPSVGHWDRRAQSAADAGLVRVVRCGDMLISSPVQG